MPPSEVEILQQYSSCELADSLQAVCKDAQVITIPNLTRRSGDPDKSIVGPAYTVEFASKSDNRPAVPSHYIDSIPKDAVVLIGVSREYQTSHFPYSTLDCALYGGLMSTRAKYLGAAGTLVLGNIRDVSEHRKLNYPVVSYGVAVSASSINAKVVSVGKELALPNGVIQNGDWVLVDENGAVVIPKDMLQEVVIDVSARVEADRLVSEDILEGKPAGESMKSRRAKLRARAA